MNPRISLLLRRSAGQAVSSDRLAAESGLSVAHVGAAVQDLQQAGFDVESHPMLGYRFLAPPPHLVSEELAWGGQDRRAGRIVRCVGVTASTNDLAWEAVSRGRQEADGLAVFAEHQAAGRGRRGGRWLAPPHSSILCSVIFWVPADAAILTRGAGLAAALAVEDQGYRQVGIRWPNDIVMDDRKVGGILVEVRQTPDGENAAVIGIGINCTQSQDEFPRQLRNHAGSLAMMGEDVDRTLLARALLGRLDEVVARMATEEGAADIQSQAARRCVTLGRRITLLESGSIWTGDVLGLEDDYGLVLRLAEGGIRRFPAMTTHVLGPEA